MIEVENWVIADSRTWIISHSNPALKAWGSGPSLHLGPHLKMPHTRRKVPRFSFLETPTRSTQKLFHSWFQIQSSWRTRLTMMPLCTKLWGVALQWQETVRTVWKTTLEICGKHQRHHQDQGSIFSRTQKIVISDSIFFLLYVGLFRFLSSHASVWIVCVSRRVSILSRFSSLFVCSCSWCSLRITAASVQAAVVVLLSFLISAFGLLLSILLAFLKQPLGSSIFCTVPLFSTWLISALLFASPTFSLWRFCCFYLLSSGQSQAAHLSLLCSCKHLHFFKCCIYLCIYSCVCEF